jgi:hypothetical protein
MNATERKRYAALEKIKLMLKKAPIGTIARRYTRPFIGTFFLESRRVVKRANSWVMMVAKMRCHVVRKIGYLKPLRSKTHLLKMMTVELRVIHTLSTS